MKRGHDDDDNRFPTRKFRKRIKWKKQKVVVLRNLLCTMTVGPAFKTPSNPRLVVAFSIAVLSLSLVSPVTSWAPQSSSMAQESSTESSVPRFSVGLIADIQYAPIPDGHSYSGVPRYYRHARKAARSAAAHFQSEKLPMAVNLGDIVDGKCQDLRKQNGNDDSTATTENKSRTEISIDPGHEAVHDVLEALSVYQHGPILHAYGNHCLYNLDRQALAQKLKIPFVQEPCGDMVGYSSYTLQDMRFIVLDSYDIAKVNRCPDTSQKYQQAHEILLQNNPNYPEEENSPVGLDDLEKRFVAFNGAVGPVH